MVFILGASSLHHALESLSKKARKRLADRVFTLPGFSCNPNALNKRKTVQFLLNTCFKHKRELIIWQDVVNNSLSEHPSNSNNPLTPQQFINVLVGYGSRIKAVVYCKRQGVPDIFSSLKKTLLTVHILKDLISKRKARDRKLLKQYSSLHQLHELELKSLTLVFKYSANFYFLIQKSRPKKLNKRRRRALRNRLQGN